MIKILTVINNQYMFQLAGIMKSQNSEKEEQSPLEKHKRPKQLSIVSEEDRNDSPIFPKINSISQQQPRLTKLKFYNKAFRQNPSQIPTSHHNPSSGVYGSQLFQSHLFKGSYQQKSLIQSDSFIENNMQPKKGLKQQKLNQPDLEEDYYQQYLIIFESIKSYQFYYTYNNVEVILKELNLKHQMTLNKKKKENLLFNLLFGQQLETKDHETGIFNNTNIKMIRQENVKKYYFNKQQSLSEEMKLRLQQMYEIENGIKQLTFMDKVLQYLKEMLSCFKVLLPVQKQFQDSAELKINQQN